MPLPQPIANCYWVEPGKLLAGEYPIDLDEKTSLEKLLALKDGGVTAFIDLTEANEPAGGTPLRPYADLLESASHRRFPIRDTSIPDSPELTTNILDTIDRHINAGQTVYVHCWGGVGRTGTVVGCWLARHGYRGQAALDRLEMLWQACPKSDYRDSPESESQRDYVRHWGETGCDGGQ